MVKMNCDMGGFVAIATRYVTPSGIDRACRLLSMAP
jgi:hypothetical protein